MKYLKFLTALIFIAGFSSSANALTIDLSTYDCSTGPDCESLYAAVPSSPADEIDNIEAAFGVADGLLNLLYKSEEKKIEGPEAISYIAVEEDNAPYDPYYTTTYTPAGDPDSATISWDGGLSINCPDCYLYVKDGASQDPNAYIFNLGTALDIGLWNGTDDIVLSNFWPGGGAISHIAIYGVSPIPVPAAVWLFGTALIGFIGFSRRTSV